MISSVIVQQVLKHFPDLRRSTAVLPIESALRAAVYLARNEPGAFEESPGQRLRFLREEREITQLELAVLGRTSQGNISAIESGARPLGPKTARRLAKILNCDFRELI